MTPHYKSSTCIYIYLLTAYCIFSYYYYCKTNIFSWLTDSCTVVFYFDLLLKNILSWLTACCTIIFSLSTYCTTVICIQCSCRQVLTTSRCWVTLSTLWRPQTLRCRLRSCWGWRHLACTPRGYWSGLYPHIWRFFKNVKIHTSLKLLNNISRRFLKNVNIHTSLILI